jgi:hypothetical protein
MKKFLEQIEHDLIERDAFAVQVMVVTDCTKDVADELARNIHPDFRDIAISRLCYSATIERIHDELGNTFHSASWSLRMAVLTLVLTVSRSHHTREKIVKRGVLCFVGVLLVVSFFEVMT